MFTQLEELKRKLTTAADHIVIIGTVDGPAVVFRVVEVVPAVHRLWAGLKKCSQTFWRKRKNRGKNDKKIPERMTDQSGCSWRLTRRKQRCSTNTNAMRRSGPARNRLGGEYACATLTLLVWPFTRPLHSPEVQSPQEALQSRANPAGASGLTFTAPAGHRPRPGNLPFPSHLRKKQPSRAQTSRRMLLSVFIFQLHVLRMWLRCCHGVDDLCPSRNLIRFYDLNDDTGGNTADQLLEAAFHTLWTLYPHILVG